MDGVPEHMEGGPKHMEVPIWAMNAQFNHMDGAIPPMETPMIPYGRPGFSDGDSLAAYGRPSSPDGDPKMAYGRHHLLY